MDNQRKSQVVATPARVESLQFESCKIILEILCAIFFFNYYH